MASLTTRKLMDKYMKAINPQETSELFHLTIRPEYSSYTPNQVCLACNFSDTRNAFVTLTLTPPFRIVRSKDVEQKLVHTVTRTQYNNQKTLVFNRFSLNITELPVEFLDKLINYIYMCQDPRINYSWIEPLQDLVIQQTTPIRPKVKVKAIPLVGPPIEFGEDEDVLRVKRSRLTSVEAELLGVAPKPKESPYSVRSEGVQREILQVIASGNKDYYLDPTGTVYRQAGHKPLFKVSYSDYVTLRDFVIPKKIIPKMKREAAMNKPIKEYSYQYKTGITFVDTSTQPVKATEEEHLSASPDEDLPKMKNPVDDVMREETVEQLKTIAKQPFAAPTTKVTYIPGTLTTAGAFEWTWGEDVCK